MPPFLGNKISKEAATSSGLVGKQAATGRDLEMSEIFKSSQNKKRMPPKMLKNDATKDVQLALTIKLAK